MSRNTRGMTTKKARQALANNKAIRNLLTDTLSLTAPHVEEAARGIFRNKKKNENFARQANARRERVCQITVEMQLNAGKKRDRGKKKKDKEKQAQEDGNQKDETENIAERMISGTDHFKIRDTAYELTDKIADLTVTSKKRRIPKIDRYFRTLAQGRDLLEVTHKQLLRLECCVLDDLRAKAIAMACKIADEMEKKSGKNRTAFALRAEAQDELFLRVCEWAVGVPKLRDEIAKVDGFTFQDTYSTTRV